MVLRVKDVIDSSVAISSKKGEILYEEIRRNLIDDNEVTVDFEGISDLTTAFLNVAIGHLYTSYSSDTLNRKLKIVNMDELDTYLLSQVIERVKMNQEEEEVFKALIKEVLNDGEDS